MAQLENYTIKYSKHSTNLSISLNELLHQNAMVDVSLVADGHLFNAHRLVLAALSPYFQQMFTQVPANQQAFVFMNDVPKQIMEDLMTFIYRGEVNIKQELLAQFFKTAEALKIKGLVGYSLPESLNQEQSTRSNWRNDVQHQSTRVNRIQNETAPNIETEPNCHDTMIKDEMHFNYDYGNNEQNGAFNLSGGFDELTNDFSSNPSTHGTVSDQQQFDIRDVQRNNDHERDRNESKIDSDYLPIPNAKRSRLNNDLFDYNIIANIKTNSTGHEHLYFNGNKFGRHTKAGFIKSRWCCTKHTRDRCRAAVSTMKINGIDMMKVMIPQHSHQ